MAFLLKRLPVVPSIVCYPRPVLHPDRRSPNPYRYLSDVRSFSTYVSDFSCMTLVVFERDTIVVCLLSERLHLVPIFSRSEHE